MDTNTGRLQERLTAELQQVMVTTASGFAAPTDPSALASDPARQKALTKLMHERLVTRGRKVEAALARMHGGTYGLCCQCEAELDSLRLEADPAVVFCASCEAERDAR